MARYSDGSTRDVSRLTTYLSNDGRWWLPVTTVN